MYVPDRQWTTQAWQCKDRDVSVVEIERVRVPTSDTAELKVIGLKIDGQTVQPRSVAGLNDFVASLAGVQTITSRCGDIGESVTVAGFVLGRPYSSATERKEFSIRYAQ